MGNNGFFYVYGFVKIVVIEEELEMRVLWEFLVVFLVFFLKDIV